MFRKHLILFLIVVSIIVYFSDRLGLLSPFKDPFDKSISPVKQFVHSSRVAINNTIGVVSSYSNFDKIKQERDLLKKQNLELNLKVKNLTTENEKLREQLGSPLVRSYQLTVALVLAVTRFLELNVGKNDGVVESAVVVDGDALIGKVVSVSASRSNVMLLTDSDISVAAKTSRGTVGTVIGSFGANIMLDKVLQKDPLFLDDLVVTSGQDGIPPNLIIGKIVHISSLDVSVYKQAKVAPPVEYQNLNTVFVIASQ